MPAVLPFPSMVHTLSRETTPHAPIITSPVDDFIVRITEHNPTTPQVWRVLLDEEFEAKLKTTSKQDDVDEKTGASQGTEFRIYDLDKQEYVEQVTTYPTTTGSQDILPR